MALDKAVDSALLDKALKSTADAIRSKTATTDDILWDIFTGFAEAIKKITAAVDFDTYTGEYDITPAVGSQSLETAQKFMSDDVTVEAIPYYDVSNNSGGITVYIGGSDTAANDTTAMLGTAKLGMMMLGKETGVSTATAVLGTAKLNKLKLGG